MINEWIKVSFICIYKVNIDIFLYKMKVKYVFINKVVILLYFVIFKYKFNVVLKDYL